MASLLDNSNYYLGRLGWVGMVGALLFIAGLAYENTVVRPREAMVDEQLLHNEQARRKEAEMRALEAQTDAGIAGRPSLAPAAAAALGRLFDAADKAGLELDQGEYRLTETKDAHLRLYQLSLPVYGSYPEIRAFVAEALNTDPALALIGMQLRRETIETPEIDAMLNFTLFLEPGA